jgi:hypothetical protein
VALRVTSTGGICGLMTVGYLSVRDARGYGWYGFRSSGRAVPVGLLLGRYVAAPESADHWRAPGACGGPRSGKFSGGNRMASGACQVRLSRFSRPGDNTPATIFLLRFPVLGGRPGVFGRPRQGRIWLILPVVICLSQRLSHACLSISTLVP